MMITYFLDENNFLQTLSLVEDDDDISITQDSVRISYTFR